MNGDDVESLGVLILGGQNATGLVVSELNDEKAKNCSQMWEKQSKVVCHSLQGADDSHAKKEK